MHDLDALLRIVARLRHPTEGCPWDLAQTYETIAPHTVEEAYEVVDAIERKDLWSLKDELGDLLFQIVFYSQLGRETSNFEFSDVVKGICEKMMRRHPDIFDDCAPKHRQSKTENLSWEAIKAEEREDKKQKSMNPVESSILDGIAWTLPALSTAVKLQRRAAIIGFDWSEIEPVMKKIAEELTELEAEINSNGGEKKIQEELGDLLFACSNLARHLNMNPEVVLRKANQKFERRFRKVEALAKTSSSKPKKSSLDSMQKYWEQVKLEEED